MGLFPMPKPKGQAPANPKSPAPVIIPHEDKAQGMTRRNYNQRILPHSTDYYCWEGIWGYHQGQAPPGTTVLVEVWDRGGNNIEIHPSRNHFFLVTGVNQRLLWYAAMQYFMKFMLKAQNDQLTVQDRTSAMAPPRLQMGTPQGTTGTARPTGARPGAAGPSSPRPAAAVTNPYGKNANTQVPDWARDYSNIIGYTSGDKIAWADYPKNSSLTAYYDPSKVITIPSLYFYGGHLTTEHGTKKNIGFSLENPGTCLFFGNVLKAYVY